ncbi:SseB family protein [Streptomyces sp. ASQP_92]|nr:SseB family protein [Streptomyces sp. ASQP_92]MCT9089266.1 SseB family protein [Streptomyces sp. ASQP_92]
MEIPGGPQGWRGRHGFAAVLGGFRRTATLVPEVEGGWWTAEWGGIRWIHAFSDEAALARFAIARGEGDREWAYQRVLGARLLDIAVPALGVPAGVALDVGSPRGMVFPPVAGIVPEAVALDAGAYATEGTAGA